MCGALARVLYPVYNTDRATRSCTWALLLVMGVPVSLGSVFVFLCVEEAGDRETVRSDLGMVGRCLGAGSAQASERCREGDQTL